jgi:hypothetical protein
MTRPEETKELKQLGEGRPAPEGSRPDEGPPGNPLVLVVC